MSFDEIVDSQIPGEDLEVITMIKDRDVAKRACKIVAERFEFFSARRTSPRLTVETDDIVSWADRDLKLTVSVFIE
jgi:hypothetical protein